MTVLWLYTLSANECDSWESVVVCVCLCAVNSRVRVCCVVCCVVCVCVCVCVCVFVCVYVTPVLISLGLQDARKICPNRLTLQKIVRTLVLPSVL